MTYALAMLRSWGASPAHLAQWRGLTVHDVDRLLARARWRYPGVAP